MEQTLKITLTADNKQALEGLRQTVTAMNGVQVAAGKTGGAVVRTGRDFTGLSRVIQDLPYGINGISNNLTQLLPAAGAAGLVVSGLVTALTFANIGFGAWTRGLTNAKTVTNDAAFAFKDYSAEIKKGNDEATKSLATVSALIAASQNEKATYAQKAEILKRLNKESSTYFSDLKLENGQITGLANAYQRYAENIYLVAKAKGASERIGGLTEKLISAGTKKADIDAVFQLTPTGGIVGGIEAARKKYEELTSIINGPYFTALQNIKRIVELTGLPEQKIRDLLYERNRLTADQQRYSTQLLDIQKQVSQSELDSSTITEKKVKKQKEWMQIMGEARQTIQYNPKDYEQQIDPYAKIKAPGRVGGEMAIGEQSILGFADNQKQAADLKNLIALQQEQALTMTNLLAPAFESLFQTMAGGGDIGKALLDSFKQISVQLTAMVVKALLFKIILKSLKLSNPVTAGMELGSDIAGGISGGLSIIGLLRGQDMQLMLDRTSAGNGFRRGG